MYDRVEEKGESDAWRLYEEFPELYAVCENPILVCSSIQNFLKEGLGPKGVQAKPALPEESVRRRFLRGETKTFAQRTPNMISVQQFGDKYETDHDIVFSFGEDWHTEKVTFVVA